MKTNMIELTSHQLFALLAINDELILLKDEIVSVHKNYEYNLAVTCTCINKDYYFLKFAESERLKIKKINNKSKVIIDLDGNVIKTCVGDIVFTKTPHINQFESLYLHKKVDPEIAYKLTELILSFGSIYRSHGVFKYFDTSDVGIQITSNKYFYNERLKPDFQRILSKNILDLF